MLGSLFNKTAQKIQVLSQVQHRDLFRLNRSRKRLWRRCSFSNRLRRCCRSLLLVKNRLDMKNNFTYIKILVMFRALFKRLLDIHDHGPEIITGAQDSINYFRIHGTPPIPHIIQQALNNMRQFT